MKKLVIIAISALLLTGCFNPVGHTVYYPIVLDGLKDCKFFYMSNGRSSMQVARCPNSATSTTYSSGKTQATAVIIDGEEYVKVQK